MLFQNGKLLVRLLEEEDQFLLAKWLSDPEVLKFYEGRDNPFDLEKVRNVFYDPEDETMKCIIGFEGKEIGYIQFYQLDAEAKVEYGYSNENVYGIDQFIGEVAYWNKGIGTLLVTSMVTYLMEHEKASRVVILKGGTRER